MQRMCSAGAIVSADGPELPLVQPPTPARAVVRGLLPAHRCAFRRTQSDVGSVSAAAAVAASRAAARQPLGGDSPLASSESGRSEEGEEGESGAAAEGLATSSAALQLFYRNAQLKRGGASGPGGRSLPASPASVADSADSMAGSFPCSTPPPAADEASTGVLAQQKGSRLAEPPLRVGAGVPPAGRLGHW